MSNIIEKCRIRKAWYGHSPIPWGHENGFFIPTTAKPRLRLRWRGRGLRHSQGIPQGACACVVSCPVACAPLQQAYSACSPPEAPCVPERGSYPPLLRHRSIPMLRGVFSPLHGRLPVPCYAVHCRFQKRSLSDRHGTGLTMLFSCPCSGSSWSSSL